MEMLNSAKVVLGSPWSTPITGFNGINYLTAYGTKTGVLTAGTAFIRARIFCKYVYTFCFTCANNAEADDVYISLVPAAAVNLLVNGGCESASGGWTGGDVLFGNSYGYIVDTTTLNYPPIEGTKHCRHSNITSSTTKTITQTVSLVSLATAIDAHKASMLFDGFYRLADSVSHDSTVSITIIPKNSGGGVLKTTTVASRTTDFMQWQYFQTALSSNVIPVGTRSVDIQLTTTLGAIENIAFTPLNSGSGVLSGPFNIGFSYTFFQRVFTTFYICGNSIVIFPNINNTTPSCGNPDNTIPIPGQPKNACYNSASEWDPTNTQVRYWTQGNAPNRILVVEFNGVTGLFQGILTTQFQFFETTNTFEFHTQKLTYSLFSYYMIYGCTNEQGTASTLVTNRNYKLYSLTNDARAGTTVQTSGNVAMTSVTYDWKKKVIGIVYDGYAYYDGMSLTPALHNESICDGNEGSIIALTGASSGYILDSFGKYDNSWTCNWLIQTPTNGQIIITFSSFDLGIGDSVQVYEDAAFTIAAPVIIYIYIYIHIFIYKYQILILIL